MDERMDERVDERSDPPTMRVMTWNLWWRFGPWERRQPAIEAVLRHESPDVVCLQEVWVAEGGAHQAEVLAGALGYHVVDARSPSWDGLAFANVVLSRWPIVRAATAELPDRHGDPGYRTAVLAVVDAPFGRFPVVSTHLDWRYDASDVRCRQVDALARLVAAHRDGDPEASFPALVCGDFNAPPGSDELRRLTGLSSVPVPGLVFHDVWEQVGEGHGHTWCRSNPYVDAATWPQRRVDYVLVSWPRRRPLGNPVAAWLAGRAPVDGVVASDHYGVVADLRVA